jgi:LacI family transcriptional regulator
VATQKQVAELAGVSFITVSRVVNKEANVRPETRRRVEAAISELGYFPNHAGKALNSGRTDTLAMITPARFGDSEGKNYLIGILRGIEAACHRRHMDILLSPFSLEDPGFDYLRPYRQRKVDGLIYVGLQSMPMPLLDEIEAKRIPCVVIGDRPRYQLISWVDTDNEGAAYATTRRLIGMGHRRIAFLGLEPRFSNGNISARERGFLRAAAETADAAPRVLRSTYLADDARRQLRALLSEPGPRPTALFCATDEMALGILQEAESLGLAVPKDLSIIGFDGYIRNYPIHPTVATHVQPVIEMGMAAAEIVFQHLDTPDLPRVEREFAVDFVAGESLCPCPATARVDR